MPKKLALEPQSPKKKQGVSRNISKTGTWAFLVHGRLGNSSPSDRPALGAGWPGPLHQWPRVLDQTSSNTCDSSKGQLGEVCSCRMKVGGWNHVESPTIRFPGLGSARTNACVLSTAEKKNIKCAHRASAKRRSQVRRCTGDVGAMWHCGPSDSSILDSWTANPQERPYHSPATPKGFQNLPNASGLHPRRFSWGFCGPGEA